MSVSGGGHAALASGPAVALLSFAADAGGFAPLAGCQAPSSL